MSKRSCYNEYSGKAISNNSLALQHCHVVAAVVASAHLCQWTIQYHQRLHKNSAQNCVKKNSGSFWADMTGLGYIETLFKGKQNCWSIHRLQCLFWRDEEGWKGIKCLILKCWAGRSSPTKTGPQIYIYIYTSGGKKKKKESTLFKESDRCPSTENYIIETHQIL